MAYSVGIERIGLGGYPAGRLQIHEAIDEADAVAIATCEVDDGKASSPVWPACSTATGARCLHTLAGPVRLADDRSGARDWALNDRATKLLIGTLLAFQVALLVTLIWL